MYYDLAARLGRTVEELMDGMTSSEVTMWLAWLQLQRMTPEQRQRCVAKATMHDSIRAFFARQKRA